MPNAWLGHGQMGAFLYQTIQEMDHFFTSLAGTVGTRQLCRKLRGARLSPRFHEEALEQ